MHELSVTENILSIALKHAALASASRVTEIHLVIGQLSSIIDDSVQFYWDMVSENSICQGAKLHFSRVSAKFHCEDCSTDFEMNEKLSECPNCGSIQTHLVSGDEFYVDSIEIEKNEIGEQP